MSITLTNRDSGTLVLTQATADVGGVGYSIAGGTMADYLNAQARHSGLGVVGKNSRHNVRLERRKINGQGAQKLLAIDITISVPNDGTFSIGEVDNAVSALSTYFDTEGTTGDFCVGVSRS